MVKLASIPVNVHRIIAHVGSVSFNSCVVIGHILNCGQILVITLLLYLFFANSQGKTTKVIGGGLLKNRA